MSHTDQTTSYLDTCAELCPTGLHTPIPQANLHTSFRISVEPLQDALSVGGPQLAWILALDTLEDLMHVHSARINSLPSSLGLSNGTDEGSL